MGPRPHALVNSSPGSHPARPARRRCACRAWTGGALLLAALLAACTPRPRLAARVPTTSELLAAYHRAVEDARVAEPAEISRNLSALVPHNRALRWSGPPEDRRVLVVTWTSFSGYDPAVGRAVTLERDVWVTAAPAVAAFCRRHIRPGTDPTLRLEQLLGLPPGRGKDRFVELWVRVDDVFRPTPDPEVTDHEAELTFPSSPRFVTVSAAHRAWFRARLATSYGVDGYPWTRLGYTYDWGSAHGKVGLSEFVVRRGAEVAVHTVTPTAAYCRPGGRRQEATGPPQRRQPPRAGKYPETAGGGGVR